LLHFFFQIQHPFNVHPLKELSSNSIHRIDLAPANNIRTFVSLLQRSHVIRISPNFFNPFLYNQCTHLQIYIYIITSAAKSHFNVNPNPSFSFFLYHHIPVHIYSSLNFFQL
jgi:hypothetical protein